MMKKIMIIMKLANIYTVLKILHSLLESDFQILPIAFIVEMRKLRLREVI